MKLWIISQSEVRGFDTYDSAVVAADDEDAARMIRPDSDPWGAGSAWLFWTGDPRSVSVQYIGEAAEGTQPGIILSSYNAG